MPLADGCRANISVIITLTKLRNPITQSITVMLFPINVSVETIVFASMRVSIHCIRIDNDMCHIFDLLACTKSDLLLYEQIFHCGNVSVETIVFASMRVSILE